MVDAGIDLEPHLQATVDEARRRDDLTTDNAAWVSHSHRNGLPRKLVYGSEYPYLESTERLRLRSEGMGAEPSFAVGGFSNVWGGAALPFVQHDMDGWPINEAQLAPHYAACSKMLGLSGVEDDLSEWLPLYAPLCKPLRCSAQAASMHAAMMRHRHWLRAAGFRFGQARIAVDSEDCFYCGLCLHGCPRQLIFSARRVLGALQTESGFTYRSNIVVEQASEDDGRATLMTMDRESGARMRLDADRVFIAAGALPTTVLLMRSHGIAQATLRDSQYFLVPLLFLRGAEKPSAEKLHTMAQLFLEVRDEAISPHTVHMQVYSYNDHMAQEVRKRLGALSFAAPLADARLGLMQGYLHSNHSGAIELSFEGADIRARGCQSEEARKRIERLIGKLLAAAPKLGAAPIWPLLQIAEPGRGFHIGGAFPMSASPGERASDTLGRPFGWRRIHAVDATVLPSIPATTITLGVMANAHRIGATAAKECA